jgi:hypothetical protein
MRIFLGTRRIIAEVQRWAEDLPEAYVQALSRPYAAGSRSMTSAKARHGSYHRFDLFRGNQPRAFELPRRIPVTGTRHKVVAIKLRQRIVPAAIAGMIIDDPVWRCELGTRVGKARNHHHWRADRPGEPRKAAG